MFINALAMHFYHTQLPRRDIRNVEIPRTEPESYFRERQANFPTYLPFSTQVQAK